MPKYENRTISETTNSIKSKFENQAGSRGPYGGRLSSETGSTNTLAVD